MDIHAQTAFHQDWMQNCGWMHARTQFYIDMDGQIFGQFH